jgi:hypothetical protein
MRRGCISLGEMECDNCHRTIRHSERYLAVEEKDGQEADQGDTKRYCVECSVKKGYASYRQEKDEKILTVFPASLDK